MRRPLLVVVLSLTAALPAVAHAATMAHYDLTGLVLQSEAIVVADRGVSRRAGHTTITVYTVTRVVRGTGLAVGAAVSIDDSLYDTTGYDLARSAVLFLARREGNAWGLVGSGLRVVAGGRVLRFEQQSNPGPYVAVPQGHDPSDARDGGDVSARVTLDAFFGQLTVATRRADQLATAARLTGAARRSALFALLGPARDGQVGGVRGFYADVVAQRVERILCDAGDVASTVEASAHDGSTEEGLSCTEPPPPPALLSIAQDARAPLAIRVGALQALGFRLCDEEATPRALAALLSDPSAPVRAAAAGAVARTIGVTGSEPADNARYRRIGARSRAALRAAWDTEHNGEVLYALAQALTDDDGTVRLGAPRHGGRVAMRVAMRRGVVEARCLVATRARLTGARLLAATPRGLVEVPATTDVVRLGGIHGVVGDNVGHVWPAAGRYALTIEISFVGAAPLTAPAGTLVVDDHGVPTVEPAP